MDLDTTMVLEQSNYNDGISNPANAYPSNPMQCGWGMSEETLYSQLTDELQTQSSQAPLVVDPTGLKLKTHMLPLNVIESETQNGQQVPAQTDVDPELLFKTPIAPAPIYTDESLGLNDPSSSNSRSRSSSYTPQRDHEMLHSKVNPDTQSATSGARRSSVEAGSPRAVHLEKNRQAARKCRHKQKKQQNELVEMARTMERKNKLLKSEVEFLKNDMHGLMEVVLQHSSCPDRRLSNYVQREASRIARSGSLKDASSMSLEGIESGNMSGEENLLFKAEQENLLFKAEQENLLFKAEQENLLFKEEQDEN